MLLADTTIVSDLVRNQTRISVLSAGYIASADLANTAIAAGRADLCIMARVR